MKQFLQKLTSRKFLACLSGIVIGIVIIFGIDGDTLTTLAGAITSLASTITYILVEGRVDAKKAVTIVQNIETIAETIEDIKDKNEKEGE